MPKEKSKHMHPWLSIWVRPRETMRQIIDSNPFKLIIWFAVIWGVLSGFSVLRHIWDHYTEHPEFRSMYYGVGAILGGCIVGLLSLYIGGWLYKFTGSWIGGKGTYTEVKCAVGWAFYPLIIAIIFAIITQQFFTFPWLITIFGLVQLALFVWSFVIFLNLLAEAHKFSVLRALGTVIIAYVLVFIALMIIGLIIPLITPLLHR